jgi:hypothetical protein
MAVIIRCGWDGAWPEQLGGLLSKLRLLESKGRYARLLANLTSANNKDNLLALVLEATVAFQFESAGIELDYEVAQGTKGAGSIAFRWASATGSTVFMEVRLLQQDKPTADSIESQLHVWNAWEASKIGQQSVRIYFESRLSGKSCALISQPI